MLTKHHLSFLLPVLLGTFCGGAAAASRLELLPPEAGDLAAPAALARATRLSMAVAAPMPETRREAVAVSWAAGAQPLSRPAPFVGESREYYTEVSGAELAAGVAIHTSAPQAVVRIVPVRAPGATGARPIDPRSLRLRAAQGKELGGGAGMDMLADADRVARAGHGFAQGTSAFRLHPSLGAGSITLRADLAAAERGARYLVNVAEPAGAVALTLRTGATHYLHGQELVIHADALEPAGPRGAGAQRRTLDKMAAVLVSPAGRTFPLAFARGPDGALSARHRIDADEQPAPGLWEVRAAADAGSGHGPVKRSLRLGVAVAMPQARLDGNVNLVDHPDKLVARFGVEVGAGGRYEVRALLYGMVGGAMAPVAVAQSAAWLEPGAGQIELAYDASLLAGVRGPYELRDLSLLDQSRVGLLHRQQRGLVIDERELLRTGLRMPHSASTPPGSVAIPRKPL